MTCIDTDIQQLFQIPAIRAGEIAKFTLLSSLKYYRNHLIRRTNKNLFTPSILDQLMFVSS